MLRIFSSVVGAGLALCASAVAPAGEVTARIGAYLDSIDLNNYALALNLYAAESVYSGIDHSAFMYPMFSSFESSTTSGGSFFVRDAYVGLRKVTASDWSMGAFATLYTDGYGAERSEALQGMQARGWTVAAGLTVGKKLGPIYADLFASTDLLNKTGGQRYDLKLAYPLTATNLQFIPQLDISYYNSDYLDYYYGVRAGEATPTRPEYQPGAGTVYTPSLHLTWRFSKTWYLRAYAGLDLLPGAMVDSPIVDTSHAWQIGVGVAYDAASFLRPDETAGKTAAQSLDVSIDVFFMTADTLINLTGDAVPARKLEGFNNLNARERTYPVDLRWRIGRYHSLGFRYFELNRDGNIELDEPQVIADQEFTSGAVLRTKVYTRVASVDYGFALFNDAQKELIILGGLHATDLDYAVDSPDNSVATSTTALLPLIGARARVNPAERLVARISLDIFLLAFDQYKGQLLDVSVAGEYRIGAAFSLGAGYRLYRQDLTSRDASLIRDIRIDYHGPFLSVRAIF